MKYTKQAHLLALASSILLMYSPVSSAVLPTPNPVGYWEIKAYSFPNLGLIRTENVCFKDDYTFISTTTAGSNGKWYLKGIELKFNSWTPLANVFTASSAQFANNTSFTGTYLANLLSSGTTLTKTESGTISARRLNTVCP